VLHLSGQTRLAGVIGAPVRHSLSPAMHNAAFEALGFDWAYLAFEVAPGRARDAVVGMRALGIEGLSVTMPHKTDVAFAVEGCTTAASRLQAVNTVRRVADGRLEGHNTDGDGFLASLRDAGVDPAGRRVVLLGAGGAGRALALALGRAGAAEVAVVNRSPHPAATAAGLAGPAGRVGTAADVATADLVVNATPIGMGDGAGALPLDPALLHRDQVVADIVMYPLETALLRAARAAGATAVDGLGMLVHQAALAFTLWTGATAPVAVMRAAAERELAEREQAGR
jgi:shikimate dehydrogenase